MFSIMDISKIRYIFRKYYNISRFFGSPFLLVDFIAIYVSTKNRLKKIFEKFHVKIGKLFYEFIDLTQVKV